MATDELVDVPNAPTWSFDPAMDAAEQGRLREEIVAACKTVYDPEIPCDIYELGLIYKVEVPESRLVAVRMTLTAPGCPVAGDIVASVEEAVGSVGYMDVRFGRYGHEHTDYSRRFVRAGYGGFNRDWRGEQRTLFYVLDTGIRLEKTVSTGSPEEADRNADLLNRLAEEPVYRAPWRTDEQRRDFVAELRASVNAAPIGVEERLRDFDEDLYLQANPDLARGNVDPLRHYLWVGWRENRKLRP